MDAIVSDSGVLGRYVRRPMEAFFPQAKAAAAGEVGIAVVAFPLAATSS